MHARNLCLAAALSAALAAPPAAAVQRTFVASFGNDANPCSISSPCRGIARALTQTDANGEVIVLDSAGYGAFSISQSVSVIAPEGVYAGVTVFSGIGIHVDPGAGGKVVLSGLSVNGPGGNVGIRVSSGTQVHIQRCTVSNLNGTGIVIFGGDAIHIAGSEVRSNAANGILIGLAVAPEVFVSDTRITDNGSIGILTQGESRVVLDRVQIDNNANAGLSSQQATGTTLRFTMRDSRITGNGANPIVLNPTNTSTAAHGVVERSVITGNAAGVAVNTQSVGTATLIVDACMVSENQFDAVFASGTNAVIYVRNSVITRNGSRGMWAQINGVVNSCGNNLVALNGGAGNATQVSCTQ